MIKKNTIMKTLSIMIELVHGCDHLLQLILTAQVLLDRRSIMVVGMRDGCLWEMCNKWKIKEKSYK